MRALTLFSLGFAALVLAVSASPAQAAPDISVNGVVNEDDGLPGVCDAPCFSIEKQADVYFPGNPTDPTACPAGDYAYVYKLTHVGGSGTKNGGAPGGLIPPLTQFEIEADFSLVTTAGFIPGPNVSPNAVIVSPLNVVTWDFPVTPIFPPPAGPLGMSNLLFICSPAAPGGPGDNMVSATGVFLDAPGECIGPVAADCELQIDKTCCVPQPPSPGVDQCEGKVLSLKLQYTGDDCSATSNNQEGKAKCSGDPQSSAPIDVVVTKDEDKIAVDGMIGGNGTYGLNGTFTVTNEEDAPDVKELKASLKLRIEAPLGDQDLTIHTSCSKPLSCGDQFGSLKVVELVTTEGGTINCETPDEPGTACVQEVAAPFACDDKIASIQFEWTGAACQTPLPNPQEGKAECTGTIAGAEPVNVTYVGGDADKITVSPASDIDIGENFSITATGRDDLKSSTKFVVTDAGGVVQNVEMHTSCSKDINCGDEFGGFKIVSIQGTDGTACDLTPPGPLFADACEVPLAPPTPHCTSKILELQLAYVDDFFGEGCTVSNSQEGNATCTGVASPGEPVMITITKDADKIEANPDSGIMAPTASSVDIFSITNEEDAPDVKELKSTTEFDVSGPGGTQSIEIHTSCSKPLNLGDRFGSVVVVGIEREDDGFVGLGGEVEYQYKVTNPNPSPATVDVFDNPFGQIADDEVIPAGGMETFFATKTLFATLTNDATVTGTVNGSACTVGEDSVEVTVTTPPQGFFDCSDAKPIDGLSMVWDGGGNVCVRAYDGDAGGTLLKTDVSVAPGDVFDVTGMGGSPNDQQWEIRTEFCGALLGISEFHISCSDPNMNGVEDCGARQGNGKSDDAGLINDWLLEEIDGDVDLDCSPDPIVVPGPSFCGLGFELALLLPGLMWLRRRRSLR